MLASEVEPFEAQPPRGRVGQGAERAVVTDMGRLQPVGCAQRGPVTTLSLPPSPSECARVKRGLEQPHQCPLRNLAMLSLY